MFSSSVLHGSGRKVQSAHSIWQAHVRRSFDTGGVWEVGRAVGSSSTWEQTHEFGVVRVPPPTGPAASLCEQLLARKSFPSKLPFCFWAAVAAGGNTRGRMVSFAPAFGDGGMTCRWTDLTSGCSAVLMHSWPLFPREQSCELALRGFVTFNVAVSAETPALVPLLLRGVGL